MPAVLNLTAPGLPTFQATLAEYIRVSKKIPGEVVARKGVDVRIKMHQAMKQRQYRKGRKGGVWREQKRRFKAGRGMLVRDRSFQSDGVDKNGKRLNRWQSAVKGETERRERGIGVLAATFLDRLWRKPRKGSYLSRNQSRSLGTMMVSEQTKDTFHITASTPGVVEVAERYGVVNQALDAVTADMDKYLVRKANEAAQKALGLYKKK